MESPQSIQIRFLNRFYSIKSWVVFIPVRLMTRMAPILKQAVWCLCHHVHRNTQRLSHRRTNEQPVTQTSGINISYISQHGESLPAVCQEITSRQCTNLHNTLFSSYQLNAHFLYSVTIYMLHYNPQHISSSTLLIFRRTNCIITASGIVTLCKQPYSMPVESGLHSVCIRARFFSYHKEKTSVIPTLPSVKSVLRVCYL